MRIKKNVGGSVATSGAGKGLIKEFLGKDGVKLLDLVKKIITIHEGKKKQRKLKPHSFASRLRSSFYGKTRT